MKRSFYPILLSLLGIALISCSEEEHLPVKNDLDTNALRFSVYSSIDESEILADAHVHLYKGKTLLGMFAADDAIDISEVRENDIKQYRLKIISKGYEPAELMLAEILQRKMARKPMVVKLKPAIEIVVTTFAVEEPDLFVIDLDGSGMITVVWPDNTSETAQMPLSFAYEFETGAGQAIILKGDIRKITSFRSFGYNTSVTDISGLKHMKDLSSFEPGPLLYSGKLVLDHNKKLEVVDLFHSTLPEWFVLPKRHSIRSITVSLADRSISTREIDVLIDNIYQNTIKRKIFNGMIALTDSSMPSPSALEKIRILEDDYGWNINLNL